MPSIQKASRACFPRSVPATPRSTCLSRFTRALLALRLQKALRETGYRTAIFHSGRFGYLGMAPMIEGRGFDVREDAGAIGGHVRSSFGVDEPSTVRRMLEWVDSLESRERFFLMYLPVAGHHPYATPDYPGPVRGSGRFRSVSQLAALRRRCAARVHRRIACATPGRSDAVRHSGRSWRSVRPAPGQRRTLAVHLRRERPHAISDCGARPDYRTGSHKARCERRRHHADNPRSARSGGSRPNIRECRC